MICCYRQRSLQDLLEHRQLAQAVRDAVEQVDKEQLHEARLRRGPDEERRDVHSSSEPGQRMKEDHRNQLLSRANVLGILNCYRLVLA